MEKLNFPDIVPTNLRHDALVTEDEEYHGHRVDRYSEANEIKRIKYKCLLTLRVYIVQGVETSDGG